MKISIIIDSIDAYDMTKKCILSIIENTKYSDYEIILNDSSKKMDTIDWAKSVGVKTIHTKPSWDADAIMVAYDRFVKDSEGKYVVIMNNDIIVTENWLEPLVNIMESDNKMGILNPLIVTVDGTAFYSSAQGNIINNTGGRTFIKWDFEDKLVVPVGYVITPCTMIRKSIAEEIGGIYDRRFRYWHDDMDLCMRMWKGGYKVCVTNMSKVKHLTGKTTRKRRQTQDIRDADLLFKQKHGNDIKRILDIVTKLQKPFNIIVTKNPVERLQC